MINNLKSDLQLSNKKKSDEIARLKIQIEEQVKLAKIHDLKKFKLIKI